jgi:hypothetical protein
MDPRKQVIRGLLDEFLTSIRQADKTPIVPAPNRWFAKPEDFPHLQPMVEKALAATGRSRDDFLHGAYLDPRTGQDLTGRMMSDVGAVIDPNTGRPVMSGRESDLESFAELEKRLGNQTLSNLVRRSKFKPTGGDTLLNDIPFITTVESGPHFYGLGMEYASPTQLFQIERGTNPHLRPKSRGDVFGMGEVVGRMKIGKGPEHDVYEKLFVAPRGSDVPGKKLSKAAGGEVHAAGGGLKQAVKGKIDEFLAELNKPAKAAVKAAPSVTQVAPPLTTILPQAPAVVLPSRLNILKEEVKQRHGGQGARRVERAADEVPNLEKLYKMSALRSAFIGDNARAMMTMNPKDFERYAKPLDARFTDEFSTRHGTNGEQMSYREYMEDYLPNVGGFDDVPFLVINKEEQGLPLIPFLTGHEGRHRNRVMANQGEQAGLVQLLPRAELREPFPRKYQEDYLDALKKELGLTDNLVLPEKYTEPGESVFENQIQRPAIKLPDVYADGGEVHMDKGGDPMLADLIERYNTPRNKSRYSAGIFDSNAPGEVRSVTPTVKERMASGLQAAMESAGSDRSKARQRAQTIVGGPNSRLPGGFGVADIGAMVNPTVAAAMIPVYAESAMHDLANVPDALKRGDYIGAGVDTAFGLMDLIPAVGQGKQVAKGVAKGIKNAAISDAGYDLAQKVLNATGTAPMQIMIGPKAKTYRHDDAALAAQMEKDGRSRADIWQATRTVRAPDNELKQELSDLNMKYSVSPVRSRQYETDRKRYSQAIDKATTDDELRAAQKYYEKQRKNNFLNFTGKAQEFVEHPELFQAYPELANYAFKELEPTHKKFTAPETAYGFYSPGQKSITVSTDAPFKRSTALHELQHAIQEIEGWQGGSSPEEMAARLADRDIAKTREADLQKSIQEMQLKFPSSQNISKLTEIQKLKNIQDFLNKTKQLEGETDPYDAYRKVSGEEEARMVQARRDYPEEKLAERPPFMDYEAKPWEHITDFATGGAVMMAGGKDVTKEAIKQGVKKGISAIDEFLSSLKPGETPATAADRAAAGRAGAALIKATPQVKASEALGQAMEQGFNKTTTTQSDRTRVGGGNIGGAPFSAISEADPRYAGKVWGVMDQGTASRLANLTSPETAWSTMLGSATQLKTNPVVFAKLEKQFKKGLKEGRLQPELEDKINQNLGLFLGEGANIRDPEIWKMLDTFEKRASMADLMMGKGLPPKKGGVALGGEKSGKGVIFNPTEILIEETERGLLHPEHGGYVPTFAVGPRLFSLTGESSFRPDLHPGFPTLLEGKDLGVNMMATPTEVYLPDWHARFKANNPDRQDPGYYDLALGVKGEGLPSQDLTDEYIRHLIREGYAEGGEVDSDGVTLDDFLSKQGY